MRNASILIYSSDTCMQNLKPQFCKFPHHFWGGLGRGLFKTRMKTGTSMPMILCVFIINPIPKGICNTPISLCQKTECIKRLFAACTLQTHIKKRGFSAPFSIESFVLISKYLFQRYLFYRAILFEFLQINFVSGSHDK